MQLELDRNWSLEDVAALAGYHPHHVAHAFSSVVGEPPASYVRRLRLERAAATLLTGATSVLDLALQSGYASAEAFTRAFRKAYGVSPSEFRALNEGKSFGDANPPVALQFDQGWPTGLSQPKVGRLESLRAWTTEVPGFAPAEFSPVMAGLLNQVPPDGPWQFGCLAQPWGWLHDGFRKDLRAVRYVDHEPRVAQPPLVPWRSVPSWYATFEFEGPLVAVHPLFEWLMNRWIPQAGLRPAFLPMLSQIERYDPNWVRARLHAPVRAVDPHVTPLDDLD